METLENVLTKIWGWIYNRQDVNEKFIIQCYFYNIMCSNVGRKSWNSVQYIYICVIFICASSTHALPLSELYPFGSNTTDSQTPRQDDGGSNKIQLQKSFKFFGEKKTNLFVSSMFVFGILPCKGQCLLWYAGSVAGGACTVIRTTFCTREDKHPQGNIVPECL